LEVRGLLKCPVIYFGKGAYARVGTLKGKRALIVTDEKIAELGFVREAQERLQKAGIQSRVFDKVEPEPKDSTAYNCADVATDFKPDWIIGLGGGSPMDVAKGAFFLYERPDVSLPQINPFQVYGLRKKAQLAEVPTTSGTGSEVSIGIALTDTDSGKKLALTCFELVPDIAIVDPELAFKMPPQLRATTGIDALTHAIESYLTKMSSVFTNPIAIEAIQTVFKFLEKSFLEGDEEAMERMHYGATLAGIAMSNSGLGIAHGVGHTIGAFFHVPHGQAVGVTLPYAIQYCSKQSKDRYLDILRALEVKGATSTNSTQKLLSEIKELMSKVQMPTTLEGLGINKQEFRDKIPALASFAAADVSTFTSSRMPTTEQMKTILDYMIEGKPIDF
jgi:acetaldehyde dehydrogenase/alcohol dehydrogenase